MPPKESRAGSKVKSHRKGVQKTAAPKRLGPVGRAFKKHKAKQLQQRVLQRDVGEQRPDQVIRMLSRRRVAKVALLTG